VPSLAIELTGICLDAFSTYNTVQDGGGPAGVLGLYPP
jgi:hypothetical protein